MISMSLALRVTVWFASALLGFIVGLAYFNALRVSTARLASRRSGTVLAASAARLASAMIVLIAVARLGGVVPLLLTFLGFLAARALAVRREQQRRV